MGSFFANIHVRLDDSSEAQDKLRTQIIEFVKEEGFHLRSADQPADRSILLCRSPRSPWFVIYDEHCDAPDPKALEKLTRYLSRARWAVSALVSDSDDLIIELFRNRRRRDSIRLDPEAEESSPVPKQNVWKALLGEQFRDFRDRFTDLVFAEEPLEELAHQLNWDPDLAFLGYGYRDEIPEDVHIETLEFALDPRLRYYIDSQDDPSLMSQEKITHVVLVDEPLHGCGPWFYKEGRASTGVAIGFEPSEDYEKYLSLTDCQIILGKEGSPLRQPLEEVLSEGRRFLRARFPDAIIPACPVAINPQTLTMAQNLKINDLFQNTTIQVSLGGQPKQSGTLSIGVFCYVLEPKRVGTYCELEIQIRAEPWW